MTLTEIQRALDRHILQRMEENRDRSYPREGYAFAFRSFTSEPELTCDMVRAACRSLTDRGFCFYMRGLWTEDGETAGSGYGITDAGAAYLETLFDEEGATT